MANKIALTAGLLLIIGLVVLLYYAITSGSGKAQYMQLGASSPVLKETSEDKGLPENIPQTAKQMVPSKFPIGWE